MSRDAQGCKVSRYQVSGVSPIHNFLDNDVERPGAGAFHPEKKRCVFCDIAASREEASKVYENSYTIAFMNLRQANEGHVLIIPTEHYSSIDELDDETASHLMQTVVTVSKAIKQSLNPEGITIWQSNGEAAGQEIKHVHFHILPRYTGDQVVSFYPNLPEKRKREDLNRIAGKIRKALQNQWPA